MFGSGAENHFLIFAQKVSLHTNETRQCSKANTVEFWVFWCVYVDRIVILRGE